MVVASRWFREQAQAQEGLPDDPADVLALGYIRVSGKKQAGRTSPAAQRHDIDQYIRRQQWTPGEVFSDTLQGWRTDREDYLRLREEVRYQRQRGRAVVVVAVDFDRTGRLAEEMLAFGRELDHLHVQLHCVSDNGVLTGDGRFMKAFMAEKETEKLRYRVSQARRAVARALLPATGPAAWGYRRRLPVDDQEARQHKVGTGSEVRRILEAHPDEAPWVREAFARFAAGAGKGEVAAWVAGLPALARGGRNLNRVAVVAMLRNPLYIGRRVHPQVLAEQGVAHETPEDVLALPKSEHWPSLVEDATWLTVQQRLGDPRHNRRGRPVQRLLTGLLRCPVCDAPMAGGGRVTHGRYERLYRCESWALGAGKADRRCSYTAPQRKIESLVVEQVSATIKRMVVRLADPRLRPALERQWDRLAHPDAAQRCLDSTAQERTRLQERLAGVKRGLAQALARQLAGGDDAQTDEEYEQAAALLREQRRELETALAPLGGMVVDAPPAPRLPPLDDALQVFQQWDGAVATGTIPALRSVLTFVLERVVPVRVGYGSYDPTLHGPVWDALTHLALAKRATPQP